MPREVGNPHDFSDRVRDAIDVVSAGGDPSTAPELNNKTTAWGDGDEDYHEWQRTDIHCNTAEEVANYYDEHRSEKAGGDIIRIKEQ